MIFDILLTTTTVSCLIFQWFISIVIVVICGKPKKRPMPATPATSTNGKSATTPPMPSSNTTQSSNVAFADTDDPKNKSCYGVDDGVFKPKTGTSKSVDEKAGKDSKKKSKDSDDNKKKSPKNGNKNSPAMKKNNNENKENNKDKDINNKKKSDSDKTDLRSLTLEKNLAEAAKVKNPAAINRSNRYIESRDPGTTSGYALPPAPKKDAAQSSKDPKKNASAYLN